MVETSKSPNIIKTPKHIEQRHLILFMNRFRNIWGADFKITGNDANQLDDFM